MIIKDYDEWIKIFGSNVHEQVKKYQMFILIYINKFGYSYEICNIDADEKIILALLNFKSLS